MQRLYPIAGVFERDLKKDIMKNCLVFPLFCGSVLCNLWELSQSADFLLTDIHFPDKIQQEVNKGLIKSG